jgi:LysR family hca operon transcriptional activator
LELRHLRYFVAVAESRSLKLAAEEKLHTTQPSLSRQIRDLENEVGAALFLRGARGVELTPAGRIFLDHARLTLTQAEAALQSARNAANPAKPSFALGFMIGHDSSWLPKAVKLLRDQLPDIHVVISTQNSPQLATALSQARIDVAFLRREDGGPDLEYRRLLDEPLAARSRICAPQLAGEIFLSISGAALSVSGKPPALRLVIDRFLKESGIAIRPSHEVDSLGGVMSLIMSTGGIALLPAYAKTFLPDSVTTRPLEGVTPKIDLSVGYSKANPSPILKLFLSRIDELRPPGGGETP